MVDNHAHGAFTHFRSCFGDLLRFSVAPVSQELRPPANPQRFTLMEGEGEGWMEVSGSLIAVTAGTLPVFPRIRGMGSALSAQRR